MVLLSAATVPALQHLIGLTRQRQCPAGIDTDIQQQAARQGMDRSAIRPSPFAEETRILALDFTALRIEHLPCDMRVRRLLRIAASISDRTHSQASRVDDREAWGVGVHAWAVHAA
ncbi:hypothetical protein D3C85_1516260 [compost metagenome]